MIYPWQQAQWQHIQQLISKNCLPHAMLLTGLPDIGKKAFAHVLAQSLLCLNPVEQQACGHCKACRLFASSSHPDLKMVTLKEGKKDITIEQIRELMDFLHLSQSISPKRVVVIEHAERMNVNAANSLLKSLEEPATNTAMILLTSNPKHLLATIRSRCQLLTFPLPDPLLSRQWLMQQSLANEVDTLLAVASGRPLLALQYDDEKRLSQRVQLINDIGRLLTGQKSWVEIAKHWQSHSMTELLAWQLNWVQDLIAMQQDVEHLRSIDVKAQLMRINELLDQNALFSLYDELIGRIKISTHSINKQLFLEDTLLCWQRVRK